MLKETLPEVQLRKNVRETLEAREKRIFQKVNTIYKVSKELLDFNKIHFIQLKGPIPSILVVHFTS